MKKLDLSSFDEPVTEEEKVEALDLSSFDEPVTEEEKQSDLVSTGVATAEGATFGLDEILAGIGGAGLEVAEDVADALGLSTTGKLEKQGFDVQEGGEGLEGLLDEYYGSKAKQRQLKETAREEDPYAYYSALLGSGIASGGAVNQLAKGGKLAKNLSKVLPKDGNIIKEGAKAGALSGVGGGESELLRALASGDADKIAKELNMTTEELIKGAGLGGLFGGALKGAGKVLKGTKDILSDITGFESFKTGQEFTRKTGEILNEERVKEGIKEISEELYTDLNKILANFKLQKKEIREIAEEAGAKVSAGQEFSEAIEEVMNRRAILGTDTNRRKYLDALNEMRGRQPEVAKISQKLEQKKLKEGVRESSKLMKADRKLEKGALKRSEMTGEQPESTSYSNVTPEDWGMDAKGPTKMRVREDVIPTDEGVKSVKQVQDITPTKFGPNKFGFDSKTGTAFGKSVDQGSGKVISEFAELKRSVVDDIDNMSIDEAEAVLEELNRYSAFENPVIDDPQVVKEATALASRLRDKIDEAMNVYGEYSTGRKGISNIMSVLKKLKGTSEDTVAGTKDIKEIDAITNIRKIFSGSGVGSELDRERVFDMLNQLDDDAFEQIRKDADMLSRSLDYVSGDVETTNVRGLIGKAKGLAAKAGSVTEKSKQSLVSGKNQLVNMSKRAYDASPEELQQFAQYVGQKGHESYQRVLEEIANAPVDKRQAMMYSLMQEPAFRKLIRQSEKEQNGVEDVN